MLVVFAKEFKSLLRDIKAVVCIALFAAASGILLVSNNLTLGYAGIEAVLSSMSLASAIIIPFVASSVITKDAKKGTQDFLLSLPVTPLQIILGKFFALFAFFMIPTAVIGVYPFVLVMSGQNGFGTSYLSILMFMFFEAAIIALGVMTSALFKRTWQSMLTSYVSLALCFTLGVVAIAFPDSALASLIFFLVLALIVGVCVYLATKRIPHACVLAGVGVLIPVVLYFAFPQILEDAIEKFLKFLSPFRHFDPTVFGLFDLSSVFFYLSFAALFLWIALLGMNRKGSLRSKPRKPSNSRASAIVISVTALVMCVNVLLCSFPKMIMSLDMSTQRLYTLSYESKTLIDGIDEDVNLYLINPMGTEEKVKSYLQRYCEHSSRLSLIEVNTEEDTDLAAELGVDSSVPLYSLVVKSEARSKFISSEEYFTYEHSQYGYLTPTQYQYLLALCEQTIEQYSSASTTQEVQMLQSAQAEYVTLRTATPLFFKIEETVGSAIEYVTADYIPTIYFLSGHGEKNTDAKPLNLKETGAIPEDAGLIFINTPEEDLSEAEIQLLLEYTENKGRLLLLSNDKTLSMSNLMRLMSCYGLSANEGVLSSGESTKLITAVNTSLISTQLSSIYMSDLNALSFNSEASGYTSYPLLAVSVPKAKDETTQEEAQTGENSSGDQALNANETKVVAMSVYKDAAPKVAWITGADNFNVSRTDMSEEEQTEILAQWTILQSIVGMTRRTFETEVGYPLPKQYSEPMLSVDEGRATWMGVIFIGIVPISFVGIAAVNLFVRKKRSEATVVE